MKPRPIPPVTKIAKPDAADLRNVQYLVWDIDHKAWWKPDKVGYNDYTTDKAKAARFNLIEATALCTMKNDFTGNIPVMAMVPVHRGV